MPVTEDHKASARERLLDAANELFYAEGVHSVGIDRVIEKAGVAKASLYKTYGSKDELVAAYLRNRHASIEERYLRVIERFDDPKERLLAVFVAQSETLSAPGYRGCAFANATAETHASSADEAAGDYRAWIRGLLTRLATEAGVAEPEPLARQLHLLYDGAGLSVRMDHDGPVAAAAARAAAGVLVDAALGQQG